MKRQSDFVPQKEKKISQARFESIIKQNISGYSCPICGQAIDPIGDGTKLMDDRCTHISCYSRVLEKEVDRAIGKYKSYIMSHVESKDDLERRMEIFKGKNE